MNDVTFVKQFEVATVNSTGQLKVWDLREKNEQPARTFLMCVKILFRKAHCGQYLRKSIPPVLNGDLSFSELKR